MSSRSSPTRRLLILVALAAAGWTAWRFARPQPDPAAPGRDAAHTRDAVRTFEAQPAGEARKRRVEVREDVVGTVRSRRDVRIAAQIPGRVLAVARLAGEAVHAGEWLVRIDDREASARLDQANAAVAEAVASIESARQRGAQAGARLDQAAAALERVRGLLARDAATQSQLEDAVRAESEARAGKADSAAAIEAAGSHHAAARAALAQAEVALSYTRIDAPIDGVVSERLVEPGDSAAPGRPLLVVLDPASLRVEARVREALVDRIAVGAELEVEVPALGESVRGKVAEILPSADPRSRTFEARIDLPASQRIRAGMFARVRIVAGERDVVAAPTDAFERVGQLWTVLVREADGWKRRMVTLGAPLDDGAVEVLSGLEGGEALGRGASTR